MCGVFLLAALFAVSPRMAWLDSGVGESDAVTRPFTPIEVEEGTRTLHVLGRDIVLAPNGLPSAYRGYFTSVPSEVGNTARNYLVAPIRFGIEGKTASFRFLEKSSCRVSWVGEEKGNGVVYRIEGALEYEGYLKYVVTVENVSGEKASFNTDLVVPVTKDCSRFWMGLGKRGGFRTGDLDWKWDATKHQDAFWLGDVNLGMMLRLGPRERKRPLINCYYKWKPIELPECWKAGGVTVKEKDDAVYVTASGGRTTLAPGEKREWGFEFFLTPFKPINFRTHFTDRYFHPTQPTNRIDLGSVLKSGANVVNLHHNTLWNPYINYPYNADGGPLLKKFTAEAHAKGVRVKVYYTTREITQNMPEFDELNALGGEVIFKRDGKVPGWPITNGDGPHPELVKRAGKDVLPAWRETISFPEAYPKRLDLSVITNPDSRRWSNFYLAGLDLLVREYGIDGLYVDDTALDRTAMRRARRILDADGRVDRRIDMHSWSHFNEYCGWIPSDIAFMELYPYYDRLWHGEAFGNDLSPDVWLIERSGFAWGLAGEMLGRGNPFRGLVFGQTDRLGWGGKPEGTWKFFDRVGMEDMKPSGWWEHDCRVKIGGSADVKATLWSGPKADVLVLANWSSEPREVSFAVTGEGLRSWECPAIPDVQKGGGDWGENECRTLAGNGGVVLVRWKSVAQIDYLSVHSAAMNRDIPVAVVLPRGYSASTNRYPVVCRLHGANAQPDRHLYTHTTERLANRYGVIVVCPYGGATSWWMDAPAKPESKYETFVSRELVKAIDAKYRTRTDRGSRAIVGGSMGGYGACWNGFRNKEVFGAVGDVFGGLIPADNAGKWGLNALLGDPVGNRDVWNTHSVLETAKTLKNGEQQIIMAIGTDDFFLKANRALHEQLSRQQVEHVYVEVRGPDQEHSWHSGSVFRMVEPMLFRFFAAYFATGSGTTAEFDF